MLGDGLWDGEEEGLGDGEGLRSGDGEGLGDSMEGDGLDDNGKLGDGEYSA